MTSIIPIKNDRIIYIWINNSIQEQNIYLHAAQSQTDVFLHLTQYIIYAGSKCCYQLSFMDQYLASEYLFHLLRMSVVSVLVLLLCSHSVMQDKATYSLFRQFMDMQQIEVWSWRFQYILHCTNGRGKCLLLICTCRDSSHVLHHERGQVNKESE